MRRQEILDAAARIALQEGLSGITVRRVAREAGIKSGLVTHYFPVVDGLISEAFVQLAGAEREAVEARAEEGGTSVERMRRTIDAYSVAERDPLGLLWLDAWRQAADRPLLREAVVAQMELDLAGMERIVSAGVASGEFRIDDSTTAVAMRILALLDGQTASSAIREALAHSTLDYPTVADLLIATAERELGLEPGALGAV